jgi:fructose-1,6-bisphosphatase/inositol monophosphatase family enzyme
MVLNERQIDDLVEAVRSVGAREIMPHFRNLSVNDVEAKSHAHDLVTIADLAAEDSIRLNVERILPGAAFVGEEAVASNPRIIDAIDTSDTCVLVDPIDGTGNYVAGLAVFGTILAVIHKGQTIYGILYDPVVDDWMFAVRNEGSWFRRRNGDCIRLQTKRDCNLDAARGLVAIEDYNSTERATLLRKFDAVFHVRDIRCSCHEYRALASGGVDFLRSYSLKPWDHAAGLLLLQEAGGWAAVNGAKPYAPTCHDGRIVAASCESMGQRISMLTAGLA